MPDWIAHTVPPKHRCGASIDYPYEFHPTRDAFDGGERYFSVLNDALGWCEVQFGQPGEAFRSNGYAIRFRSEADAAAFKLRWC